MASEQERSLQLRTQGLSVLERAIADKSSHIWYEIPEDYKFAFSLPSVGRLIERRLENGDALGYSINSRGG